MTIPEFADLPLLLFSTVIRYQTIFIFISYNPAPLDISQAEEEKDHGEKNQQ